MSYTQTVEIAKMIEEASEGQVKVDTYSVGALVGPEELFSSVADGTIEAGYNMSMSEAEIIPVSLFLAIHGGPQDMDEMYDYMYGTDTFKLVQEGYREKGLHLLCSAGVGRVLLRARKTGVLESWESFKGTKGFASPQVIPVLTKLGGVCVELWVGRRSQKLSWCLRSLRWELVTPLLTSRRGRLWAPSFRRKFSRGFLPAWTI